jgi:enamine deaminase RidA (YjgF/YER057c/UK114 family)
VLPQPVAPVANYVPFVGRETSSTSPARSRSTPTAGIKGTVGVDVDLETAQQAARLCGINLLAQMKAACDGDLDRVKRVVKLGGFVQAGPDFIDIPKVINGCSDLMVEVLGDAGRHARSAVGVYRCRWASRSRSTRWWRSPDARAAPSEPRCSARRGSACSIPPVAHRGLWTPGGAPENSLAAFQAACAGGYGDRAGCPADRRRPGRGLP